MAEAEQYRKLWRFRASLSMARYLNPSALERYVVEEGDDPVAVLGGHQTFSTRADLADNEALLFGPSWFGDTRGARWDAELTPHPPEADEPVRPLSMQLDRVF